MKVLIACEESQTITKVFRALGIEAYLCDILPPSNTGGKKRGQKSSKGVSKNSTESYKTFVGVAHAMATQYTHFLTHHADKEIQN